jgi:hypothetical protein
MLSYTDGEAERIALATVNSNLRSDLLKLSSEHREALSTIRKLEKYISELEVSLGRRGDWV